MAVWMPVIVVSRSLATVAIDTFMTELSRVMRNWAVANVMSTAPAAAVAAVLAVLGVLAGSVIGSSRPDPRAHEVTRFLGATSAAVRDRGGTVGALGPEGVSDGVVQAGEDGQVPDAGEDDLHR